MHNQCWRKWAVDAGIEVARNGETTRYKWTQRMRISMADFEDENEFNSEDVQRIAEEAVNNVIGSDQIEYQREKVNQWSQ